MENIKNFLSTYFDWFYIPKITISDVFEILLIAIIVYYVMDWFKKTRAWTLIKGVVVLLLITAVAFAFQFNTILWIFKNTISVGVIAIIIIFQPEFRRALEQLGRRNYLSVLLNADMNKSTSKLDKRSLGEIAKASYIMGENKTGALIVIEKNVRLGDYERTGINIDAEISSQLLINIFEHNTPLHDGAVLVRDNRIVSATCYLPLTDNMDINKDLGTRHRAAIGVSEVSDSITVIVSEETGAVSLAHNGNIYRGLEKEAFISKISELMNSESIIKKTKWWKGIDKNEKTDSEPS
ncbi:MAG: diadenylate cyclase CdaA [Lachnospiraceae bacterium]